MVNDNKIGAFILNSLNESIVFLGNIIVALCLTLAPVSLVLSVGCLQSLFVFIISIFISIFFPKINKEEMSKKYIGYKILAIVIIVYGGYLMSVA